VPERLNAAQGSFDIVRPQRASAGASAPRCPREAVQRDVLHEPPAVIEVFGVAERSLGKGIPASDI